MHSSSVLSMPLPAAVLPTPTPAAPSCADEQAVDELGDAVLALIRAWRCVYRRGSESVRSGLTALEMVTLIGDDEHRLTELADLRGVGQSVISRQIGDLQAHALVCRRPDPADRRASLVRLTPTGLELLAHARALRQGWLCAALASTPTSDVRTATELLRSLAAELDAFGGSPARP